MLVSLHRQRQRHGAEFGSSRKALLMEEAVLSQGVQVASRRVRMQETDGHARQDPAGPVPYSDLS